MEHVIDSSPGQEPPLISLARLRERHLRLMSYNTEFSGILDPDRQPFFERIIKALDPDIMAFQELRSAAQVGAVIAEWLQVPLFSVEVMGNTLVSRFPILDSTALIPSGRSSAVLLDTQADLGTQLLVLNTRLIPFNDAASQQDSDELIRQLRVWRDGDGPFTLSPNTPIVHMGDFNLFGPSQLLKTISEGDMSDETQFGEDFSPDWDGTPFQDLNSLQTGRRVSFTTSGSSGGVKLDYVFYSDSVIELGNHYVLNTARMSQQDLSASSLQVQDTGLASDHLPRVVDIASISDPGSSELYFAQFGDGAGLFSQIILFNLDRDSQANVSIVLGDNDGNPLSVDLNGEQMSGETAAVIPAGGLLRLKTDGQGDLVTGWARVSSDSAVAGVILFGGTVGLAGVGNSVAQPDGFVAPMEVVGESELNTGVAIVNLEDSAAQLDLQLCDRDGFVLAQALIDLSGQGHLASFLPVFDWSPSVDFSSFDGLLKVTSTCKLAATVIQTRPGQFATLPVVALPLQGVVNAAAAPQGPGAGNGTELHFAQFADGGGLFSEIVLFNLDSSGPAEATIQLSETDGHPLVVDLNGTVEAGQLEIAIPAGGLRRFKTDGLGDPVVGSVKVTSGAPIAGVVLFGGTIGLAGVGSSNVLPNGFAAPMESLTNQVDTGIAIVNLQEESAELTLQLCDAEGTLLATISEPLASSGHLARFLSEFDWPLAVDLSDFEGTLKVTSSGPLAATVIQTRPGQFATLPVVPINSPVQTLPIPLLYGGEMQGENRTYDLLMQNGSKEFIEGLLAPTSGYNGDYLGPTLLMRKEDQVVLNVTNQLDEPTSTHWHGMHVPAAMDGGPHQMIEPGETWTASYPVLNRAGTYWYHPHLHPAMGPGILMDPQGTGYQVYRGLAGMLIVEDDTSDTLGLPQSYGRDDIPLILQDRRFHEDGSLMRFPSDFNPATDPALRKGGHFLVNGVEGPLLVVGAQVVRLRILNASNARVYNLGFSDDRTFHLVVSDGGFLAAPLAMSRLILAPAERAEILLDLGVDEGGMSPRKIPSTLCSNDLRRS